MEINVKSQNACLDIPINSETNDVKISAIQGERGIQGLSAYQVALKNGFVGTEEQWLESLKGEPGATYDDTEIKSRVTTLENRVTTLENTVGNLNDSLEEVLSGGN